MTGSKKYWIFWTKWTFIYLKNGQSKFQYRNMDGYWVLFLGKIIISNDVLKLNNDWSNL